MSIYSIFDGCVHGDLRLKNVLVGNILFVIKRFVLIGLTLKEKIINLETIRARTQI